MVVMVLGQVLEIVQRFVMEVCSTDIDCVITLYHHMVGIIVHIMAKLMNRDCAIHKLVQVRLVYLLRYVYTKDI